MPGGTHVRHSASFMPKVKLGLEVLLSQKINLLKGRTVGLIVNPTSVTSRLDHAIDLLHARREFKLAALFGPEHGARGEVQDQIEVGPYTDAATGLPVYSLYGETRVPTEEMVRGLDTLVFDMQDVGARYYTFIYTMAYAMQTAARYDKQVVVLDRPNPLGGARADGNVLDLNFRSFVGLYPLAVRHGMTVAELALLFNSEFGINCELVVVPMRGWTRGLWFDQTGLPWVIPSPNMPTLETAVVYPGMCLIEGTNLSEGRGTTKPFEFVGAPWIEPRAFAAALAEEDLPGVRFRPIYFQPTFHKWKDQLCGGVQLHVTQRDRYKSFLTAIAVIRAARHMYPKDFQWRQPPYEYEYHKLPIDILCGNDLVRRQIEKNEPLAVIEKSWREGLNAFRTLRRKYLLYQ
jgi:uncharacterized protein YbbC (DUF1343 family)